MANRSLPFHDSFFDLFEKQIIEKWEAKEFIVKVLEGKSQTTGNKQQIYHGINVLVQCGYLRKMINPRKSSNFLYSETYRVIDYRNKKNQEKMEEALVEKLEVIKTNISIKNQEVSFITKLKNEYPTISGQIDIFEQEHHNELSSLMTQKNLIKRIMDRFEINYSEN